MGAKIYKLWTLFFITAFLFVPKISFAAGWTNVGFADKNVQTTFVSPKNNNKILVGLAGGATADRNYITEDGGQTWAPISMGATTNCNQFAVNPKFDSEYWAACSNGLYHSTDGGKTFSRAPRYTANMLTVLVSENGRVYVTYANNGADFSENGIIWQDLRVPGVGSQPYLYVNKYNENQIFVSKNGSDSPGLYRSNDGGLTWVNVYNVSPVRTGVYSMVFLENGAKICATTGWGLGCSLDSGATWTTFVSPNPAKPTEPEHGFQALVNPDDQSNLLVFAIGWNGLDGKIYSYESGSSLPKILDTPQFTGYVTVSQGVVFAGAQNSTWMKGLWRNDGVVVMPEYLKKHPVIIVPGILGSWNISPFGGWELDPIYNTYTDLYNQFVAAGYEPGKTLFKFPYQWRSDNSETAYLLKQKINEAKSASGANKVDIVAHSMGGIVTRIYAQSDAYQYDINQIVFLGTPQTGSVSSYPMWEAADFSQFDLIQGMVLKAVLKEEAWQQGYTVDAVLNYIRNDVPSIAQLLPIYSYLNNKIYPEGYPRNELLESLEANKAKLQQRGVMTTNIVGEGINTLTSADILNGDYGIYWPDGKPSKYYNASGDGTVLLTSQLAVPGNTIVKNGVKHIDLPRASIKDVFGALGISYSPDEAVNNINKYLFVAAYSPVDFYVVAPDGKKIGFNKDGLAFDEITGAFYTGNTSETEFLTIPNPLPGEYKVMTYGNGTGSYEIEATYANGESDSSATSSYTGQATPGKEDKLLVELSPDTGSIETKIDDKTAPVTTVTSEGTSANGYFNSDVRVTLSATDAESGVKKTEYSLDGILWQDYASPIVLNQDGETIVYYRSIDQAGNVEITQNITIKIDKTAPEANVSLNRTIFTHWDKLSIKCVVTDDYSGVNNFIVKLDGTVINCAEPVSLFDQNLGIHVVEYMAADNAENVVAGRLEYSVIANYDSTARDIVWLYENKHFKNRGDAVSLLVQVEVSHLFNTFGLKKRAVEALSQAWSLADKQIVKSKISSYGYDMIIKDIKYILEGK